MIIQYLIRTFAPSCLSPAICFLTFCCDELSFFIDPEIASFSVFVSEIPFLFSAFFSGIASFFSQLPTPRRFRLPFVFSPLSFGTAKVETFFKLANFIFFYFCLPLFSRSPLFYLPRLRAAKM